MESVFVSHAAEDRYFVDLFVTLLEFHGVSTWYSSRHLKPGDEFRPEIDQALSDSDGLVVVVSRHAAQSSWVTHEVAVFKAKNPERRVLPILLDETSPDVLADRLADQQAIDFSSSQLEGYRALLDLFGKSFLARPERRKVTDRREGERRIHDRVREHKLLSRMRIGFWKSYANEGSVGKFDPVNLSLANMMHTLDALLPAAASLDVADSNGNRVAAKDAIEAAVHRVWEAWRDRGPVKAVYLVEAIAEQLHDAYSVRETLRRERRDRRVGPSTRRS